MTRFPIVSRALWAGSLALFVSTAEAQTPPVTRFDGIWAVDLSCEKAADGALGYSWEFNAQVLNGQLHGEHGQRGKPASMTLDGPIQADGTAMLVAVGLTGTPLYNLGHVGEMQRIRYHVKAQFGATSGAGTRVEARPCSMSFARK